MRAGSGEAHPVACACMVSLGHSVMVKRLLHAAPQDLVGRDQHHAYNKGHGEGADKALPYTGLSVLLLGVHCGEDT